MHISHYPANLRLVSGRNNTSRMDNIINSSGTVFSLIIIEGELQ